MFSILKYFEEYVQDQLRAETSPIGRIIKFFHHYASYTTSVGLENTRAIYNVTNPIFAKRRQMEVILEDIIKEGQSMGEISTDMTAEEIRWCFFITIRGLIFDWCARGGSYDLEEAVDIFIKTHIKTLNPKITDDMVDTAAPFERHAEAHLIVDRKLTTKDLMKHS